ncbi:DNA-3-methyladenine glycosylase I [Faunimonas pinastri]|uniref:DNA-3-methyladenine glycosylase I n=1 Tax=Faunimonas pinastri TaxID=1855383 RepID=A0A1H8ZIJ1_9HYPH|nr:DNA-3-methyladenine glycosylase I [Faunimonas pinastri]SEP64256.1 DNA-3-methyladenine glycosylase I [Faunimonas pinastri]
MAERTDGLVAGEDGRLRCSWQGNVPIYRDYHDEEWGRPVGDDRRLFEKICLEGFQSGLSWLTILRKREAFRAAFAGFDPETVVRFGPAEVERCLGDAGIVRHRGKIASVVNNARRMLELVEREGSLAAFIWRYEPKPEMRPTHVGPETLRAITQSPESVALSKELRRRGWSFVGPTTCYAFMQSMGLVNDHLEGCCCREAVEAARAGFARPI